MRALGTGRERRQIARADLLLAFRGADEQPALEDEQPFLVGLPVVGAQRLAGRQLEQLAGHGARADRVLEVERGAAVALRVGVVVGDLAVVDVEHSHGAHPSTWRSHGEAKRPLRVELRARRLEGVPARVAGRELGGGQERALAPVRPPAERGQRRLHLAERRLVVHALEQVHGHERAVAPVGGREQGVVARREAQLDGNETGWRARISRAASSPSTAAARGSAYSISSKRTSRGEAKMACDQSTRSRREATEAAKRLRRGISRGRARASRLTAWNARLSSSTSLT